MPPEIIGFAETDIGTTDRERNADSAKYANIETRQGHKLLLAMVCDGVGSTERGATASAIAANTIVHEIENSTQIDLLDIINAAIVQANQKVVTEFPNAEGATTVAMAVVHLNAEGSKCGKLYVASVGDSPIFLVRNEKLARLNSDHNVITDLQLSGQPIPRNLEKPERLTRVVGVFDQVEVDFGIYIGDPSREKAARRGKNGIDLEEHDTVYVCSDGMIDPCQLDGLPLTSEDAFIKNAMQRDVKRTVLTLIGDGVKRLPSDNISLATVFVPGPKRRDRFESSVPIGVRIGLAGLAVFACAVIAGAVVLASRSNNVAAEANQRVAQANETQTQLAVVAAYTPTPSETFTPLPTHTYTPTAIPPTARPTVVLAAGQVQAGFLFAQNRTEPVLVGEELSVASEPAFIPIDGGQASSDPGSVFLLQNSSMMVDDLSDTEFALVLFEGGRLFAANGQYLSSSIELDQGGTRFSSQGACISARYTQANEVSFACYALPGASGGCELRPRRGSAITLNQGSRVLWNVSSTSLPSPQEAIPFDEALVFYEFVDVSLGVSNPNAPPLLCLRPIVDADNDSILDFEGETGDQCPNEAGIAPSGCPDHDGDIVPDNVDRCPALRGLVSNRGCPVPTTTPPPTGALSTAPPTMCPSGVFNAPGCGSCQPPNVIINGRCVSPSVTPCPAGVFNQPGCATCDLNNHLIIAGACVSFTATPCPAGVFNQPGCASCDLDSHVIIGGQCVPFTPTPCPAGIFNQPGCATCDLDSHMIIGGQCVPFTPTPCPAGIFNQPGCATCDLGSNIIIGGSCVPFTPVPQQCSGGQIPDPSDPSKCCAEDPQNPGNCAGHSGVTDGDSNALLASVSLPYYIDDQRLLSMCRDTCQLGGASES